MKMRLLRKSSQHLIRTRSGSITHVIFRTLYRLGLYNCQEKGITCGPNLKLTSADGGELRKCTDITFVFWVTNYWQSDNGTCFLMSLVCNERNYHTIEYYVPTWKVSEMIQSLKWTLLFCNKSITRFTGQTLVLRRLDGAKFQHHF